MYNSATNCLFLALLSLSLSRGCVQPGDPLEHIISPRRLVSPVVPSSGVLAHTAWTKHTEEKQDNTWRNLIRLQMTVKSKVGTGSYLLTPHGKTSG